MFHVEPRRPRPVPGPPPAYADRRSSCPTTPGRRSRDPASRDAADAERQVEAIEPSGSCPPLPPGRPELHDRAGTELLLDRPGPRRPPCLAPRALPFAPFALPSSPSSVTLLSHRWTAHRTGRGSARRSGLFARRPRRPALLRGFRITSTFCGGSDSGDSFRLGRTRSFGFFFALAGVHLESPSMRLRGLGQGAGWSFTPDFSATSLPLIRPARSRSSAVEAGNVPAWIALGSWP